MPAWFPHIDSAVALDSLKSILLLFFLLIVRTILVRAIARNPALPMEAKRRWVVSVRSTMLFVLLVGLVAIWAHELQALAVRQMKLLEQTNLLEAPSPEPRITIQLIESGRIQLVLRFPSPDRGRSRIEQAILRRFLAEPG